MIAKLILCRKKIRPCYRASAGAFIWENFHPCYRGLGGKNLELGNRVSPVFHINSSKFLAVPKTRSAECGVRSAECGVRSAECGVRSAECGVRSAECGVRSLKEVFKKIEIKAEFKSELSGIIKYI